MANLYPGTGTRIDGTTIVLNSTQVGGVIIIVALYPIIIISQVGGGTIDVPPPTRPASTLKAEQELKVPNKSSIAMVEREWEAVTPLIAPMTAGRRRRSPCMLLNR